MNSRISAPLQWLQKNQANIKWKLVGPNIQNPFDMAASTEKLREYVMDRSLLLERCSVHAHMDETTIMRITDLNTFAFASEHPNLMGLSSEDLQRFLEASGTWKSLQEGVINIQKACEGEIKSREGAVSY